MQTQSRLLPARAPTRRCHAQHKPLPLPPICSQQSRAPADPLRLVIAELLPIVTTVLRLNSRQLLSSGEPPPEAPYQGWQWPTNSPQTPGTTNRCWSGPGYPRLAPTHPWPASLGSCTPPKLFSCESPNPGGLPNPPGPSRGPRLGSMDPRLPSRPDQAPGSPGADWGVLPEAGARSSPDCPRPGLDCMSLAKSRGLRPGRASGMPVQLGGGG